MNDDLGAFNQLTALIAQRSISFENAKALALLASVGPNLSDGKALFHVDHSNYQASGTTIANGLGAAVAAMRKQVGLDGLPIDVQPRFLLVGPDQEVQARQMVATIIANQTSNANPWSGAFEVLVDTNITGNRWYLLSEPLVTPSIVYGYVNGANGPQVTTEIDFDTKALKVRAGLDFACGVVDFRGAYLNAGA
ncbi:MAG: hypothetical protein GC191_18580 [Azospirillum sp.]|nr:hypothetical protein [Azospirillum sp.]